eukprot:756834-Hanusia_phi.AAC.1
MGSYQRVLTDGFLPSPFVVPRRFVLLLDSSSWEGNPHPVAKALGQQLYCSWGLDTRGLDTRGLDTRGRCQPPGGGGTRV